MAADAGEYYRRLEDILGATGFNWVIAQAQEQIAQGRAVTKQVQAPEVSESFEAEGFSSRARRRRRTSLVTTEPYNDRERLHILLDAIEAALVQRVDFETSILLSLEAIQRVEFVPDDTSGDPARAGRYRHGLARDRVDDGATMRDSLLRALRAIQDDVDVSS